eukprot:488224-Rhodomonas_salina.1
MGQGNTLQPLAHFVQSVAFFRTLREPHQVGVLHLGWEQDKIVSASGEIKVSHGLLQRLASSKLLIYCFQVIPGCTTGLSTHCQYAIGKAT